MYLQASLIGVGEMIQPIASSLEVIFVVAVIIIVFMVNRRSDPNDDAAYHRKDKATASARLQATSIQHRRKAKAKTITQADVIHDQQKNNTGCVSEKVTDQKLSVIRQPEPVKKKTRKRKGRRTNPGTRAGVLTTVLSTNTTHNQEAKAANISNGGDHRRKPRKIATDCRTKVVLHLPTQRAIPKFEDDAEPQRRTANGNDADHYFQGLHFAEELKYPEQESVEGGVDHHLHPNTREINPKPSDDDSERSSGSKISDINSDLLYPRRGIRLNAAVENIDVDTLYIDGCQQNPSDKGTNKGEDYTKYKPVMVVEQTRCTPENEATVVNGNNISAEQGQLNDKNDDGQFGVEQSRQAIKKWARAINVAQNCSERIFPDRVVDSKRIVYQPSQAIYSRQSEVRVNYVRHGTAGEKSGAVKQRRLSNQFMDREVTVIEADEDLDSLVESVQVDEHCPEIYSGTGVYCRQDVVFPRRQYYDRTTKRRNRGTRENNDAGNPSYSRTWNIGDVIADLETNQTGKLESNREKKTSLDETNHQAGTSDGTSDSKDNDVPTPQDNDDLAADEEDRDQISESATDTNSTSDLKVDDSDSSDSEDNGANNDSSLTVSVATFADRLFLSDLATMNDLDPDKVFVRQNGMLTLDVRCGTKKEVLAIVVYFLSTKKGEIVRIVTGRGLRSPYKIPVINKVVEKILSEAGIEFKEVCLGGAYQFDY